MKRDTNYSSTMVCEISSWAKFQSSEKKKKNISYPESVTEIQGRRRQIFNFQLICRLGVQLSDKCNNSCFIRWIQMLSPIRKRAPGDWTCGSGVKSTCIIDREPSSILSTHIGCWQPPVPPASSDPLPFSVLSEYFHPHGASLSRPAATHILINKTGLQR